MHVIWLPLNLGECAFYMVTFKFSCVYLATCIYMSTNVINLVINENEFEILFIT